MKIQPANYLKGEVKLPGDKSISHRAAIFAALAEGETRIENFATSADCASTLDCLENLGVEIERENTTIVIKGVGKTGFRTPEKELDCGNSGTTMRLLAGVLAGQNFDSVLVGDASLNQRPMKRIMLPLAEMGANHRSDGKSRAAENLWQKSFADNKLQSSCAERTSQILRFARRFECRRKYDCEQSES